MSFTEYEDAFSWRCDGCELTVEFEPKNFFGCVAELKARGWQFSRDREGRWEHRCGRCRKRSSAAELLDRKPKRKGAAKPALKVVSETNRERS